MMKASELIEKLQKIVAENGDVEITIFNEKDTDNTLSDISIVRMFKDMEWVICET